MILMKRATRAERPEPLRTAAEAEARNSPRQCARWVADHAEELRERRAGATAAAVQPRGRLLAPVVRHRGDGGGDWPRGSVAAADGTGAPVDAGEGRGVRLLADVGEQSLGCAYLPEDRLPSKAALSLPYQR